MKRNQKVVALILIAVIIVSISSISVYATETKFSDVPNNAWYIESMYKLIETGAIVGFPDGTFKPQDNVAVDQFIKMVVIANGNMVEAGKDYWAQPYIDYAIENGLVLDGEYTDYRRPIARGEMARILVRALKDVVYMNDMSAYAKMIGDYEKTDKDFKEYILKAYVTGLMNGYADKTFKFANNATRAEAATMIHRLIDVNERVQVKDPANSSGEYTNYMDPQDVLRKVMELEMLGNFEEAYKYLDKGFTRNGAFTVEDYKSSSKLHVSQTLKFMSLRYSIDSFIVRCKIVEQKSDNRIIMAYCIFDREIAERTGDGDPYDAKAKTMVMSDGLWYIDLGNTRTAEAYGFKYKEGI